MAWNHARQLERELNEARRDTERLDWLQQGHGVNYFSSAPYFDIPGCPYHLGDEDIRLAIDAAMKEDK